MTTETSVPTIIGACWETTLNEHTIALEHALVIYVEYADGFRWSWDFPMWSLPLLLKLVLLPPDATTWTVTAPEHREDPPWEEWPFHLGTVVHDDGSAQIGATYMPTSLKGQWTTVTDKSAGAMVRCFLVEAEHEDGTADYWPIAEAGVPLLVEPLLAVVPRLELL